MDDDLDELLIRYRPSGPPAALRDRIMEGVPVSQTPSLREWVPALAAALLIVVLYSLAAGLRDQLADQISPSRLAPIEQPLVPTDEQTGLR